MTHRTGRVFVIAKERPQQCDFCGKVAELRPYGPKGEAICYQCATATPEAEEAARRQFKRRLEEEGI